jgi:hypothetical protein
MTTLSDLINETRTFLYSNQQPYSNKLGVAITDPNATNFTLSYDLGAIAQRGAIVAIDLEHIRIWETSGTRVTLCDRGVDGSTPATHTNGAFVEAMPKFSPYMIQRAINEDLDDLASPSAGLFAIKDLELTYNAAVSGYDMTGVTPDNVLAIQEIRYKIPGPTMHLPAIRSFEVARSVPTTDYPSGMALLLNESAHPGLPMHVRYRSRFSHLVNLTDDLQTVAGLPAAANGLPALGAACSLMAGREVKRNFTEATTDPLQLELVTGGQVLNSYKGLLLLRQERIMRVASGLLKQWGYPLRVL